MFYIVVRLEDKTGQDSIPSSTKAKPTASTTNASTRTITLEARSPPIPSAISSTSCSTPTKTSKNSKSSATTSLLRISTCSNSFTACVPPSDSPLHGTFSVKWTCDTHCECVRGSETNRSGPTRLNLRKLRLVRSTRQRHHVLNTLLCLHKGNNMIFRIIRNSDLCFLMHWCVKEWKIEGQPQGEDVHNDRMYGYDSRGVHASKYTKDEVGPLLDFLAARFPNTRFTVIPQED